MSEAEQSLSLYYRHSGRVAPGPLAVAVVAAMAAALLAGAIVAYGELYLTMEKLIYLLVLGASIGLGAAAGGLLYWAKARNVPVAMAFGVLTGAAGLYCAWLFWLHGLLHRFAEPDSWAASVTLWDLASHPRDMWELMERINKVGAWRLGGNKENTRGLWLAMLWAIEGGTFLISGAVLPVMIIRQRPFCEQCKKWGVRREIVQVTAGDEKELRRAMESKDFEFLVKQGLWLSESQWWNLSLEGCADCDTTQTLSVERCTLNQDKKNNTKISKKKVIRQLRLTPEETVRLCEAAARLRASAVPTEETSTTTEEPPVTPSETSSDAPHPSA